MKLIKKYSRSEIVKRSRQRKKIFKEEAKNVGLHRLDVWVTEEAIQCLEPLSKDPCGTSNFIATQLESVLILPANYRSAEERMSEVETRSFLRQKKEML